LRLQRQIDEYMAMIEAGAVDPARSSAPNVCPVAGLLITTEVTVAEMPKEGGIDF
jgi:hypothetical protein